MGEGDVVTESVKAGRRIVVLPVPTPVGLFIATLNGLRFADGQMAH